MRCAIITVTPNGAKLAQKLRAAFTFNCIVEVYGKEERFDKALTVKAFKDMRVLIGDIFPQYDAIIFFCAVGIAVRMIAPYITKKDYDPAVVVIDEKGRFAISLLSGHLGGANELAQKAAVVLNAVPVITTATDVNGVLAPDLVARRLGFKVAPLENVKVLNQTLLAGKTIRYYIDKTMASAEHYRNLLKAEGISADIISIDEVAVLEKPSVLVTDKGTVSKHNEILYLRPRRLIAGIGCRRGIPGEHIENCLRKACQMIDKDIKDIVLITSVQIKSSEQGILATAEKYNIPTKFFENDILQQIIEQYGLLESPFVKKQIGIGNICEAAALAGGNNRLALNKVKFEKVTVALAWEK